MKKEFKTIKELKGMNEDIYKRAYKTIALEGVIELIKKMSKLRLYRGKSCQLLARRLIAMIEG